MRFTTMISIILAVMLAASAATIATDTAGSSGGGVRIVSDSAGSSGSAVAEPARTPVRTASGAVYRLSECSVERQGNGLIRVGAPNGDTRYLPGSVAPAGVSKKELQRAIAGAVAKLATKADLAALDSKVDTVAMKVDGVRTVIDETKIVVDGIATDTSAIKTALETKADKADVEKVGNKVDAIVARVNGASIGSLVVFIILAGVLIGGFVILFKSLRRIFNNMRYDIVDELKQVVKEATAPQQPPVGEEPPFLFRSSSDGSSLDDEP